MSGVPNRFLYYVQSLNMFLYSKLIVDRIRTCIRPHNGPVLPLDDYEFAEVMNLDYGQGNYSCFTI